MIRSLVLFVVFAGLVTSAAVWAADGTNSYTANRDLDLVQIQIRVAGANSQLVFFVRFSESTSKRVARIRHYVASPDLSVVDEDGGAMPPIPASVRRALVNGGTSNGLIPELKAYIQANQASFVE